MQNPFELTLQLNDGSFQKLGHYKGKKILLVNTASDCGYTEQYAALQKLYEASKDHLQVIGFPSNDFKEQEKGSDEEIAKFCAVNFGITFPLAKKTIVRKQPGQNEVFQWLTDKTKNGWLNKQPSWNFSKWIINEEGILTHYFDPAISPLSKDISQAIAASSH